jgi:putative hydrolase of HD superfamily
VAVIGMFLATIEKADTGKVVMMCLTHDWPETRSNDHNWVHKKNVRTDVMGIITQQFDLYEMPSIKAIIDEYEERKTHESIIAKDSDTIDQLLLLKEYELIGNKEATRWLQGKTNQRPYAWIDRMKLDSAKQLGKIIYDISPSDWWNGLYTSDNLSFS